MTLHEIRLEESAMREFCHRWNIRELAIFGSILRDDFRPDSDVDFLFTLEDPSTLTFDSWAQMEEDLQRIVGRPVELVTRRSVEASENAYRRRHILDSARPVYVEG